MYRQQEFKELLTKPELEKLNVFVKELQLIALLVILKTAE